MDVSDHHAPQPRGFIELADSVEAIVAVTDTVYAYTIGDHSFDDNASARGLAVIDVSDPDRPTRLGEVALARRQDPWGLPWSALLVHDGHVFILDTELGLAVVDVRRPDRPIEVRRFDGSWPSYQGVFIDERLYVADQRGDLVVLDASNPANPTLVERIRLPNAGSTERVAAAGPWVYSVARPPDAATYELRVIDAHDPLNLTISGTLRLGTLRASSPPTELWVEGDHLLALDGKWLRSYDVSDPRQPSLAGGAALPVAPTRYARLRQYVLVSGDSGSIWAVDVSQPDAPKLYRSVALTGLWDDWGVAADQLYVVRKLPSARPPQPPTAAVLETVNVDDFGRPHRLGRLEFPIGMGTGAITSRAIDGYAYVGTSGLNVFDLRDPTNPILVGLSVTDFGLFGGAVVGLDGRRLYTKGYSDMGARGCSMLALDIQDRAAPEPIGGLGCLADVSGAGGYVYGAEWEAGLGIWQHLGPGTPTPNPLPFTPTATASATPAASPTSTATPVATPSPEASPTTAPPRPRLFLPALDRSGVSHNLGHLGPSETAATSVSARMACPTL
jgi:hypothetical protein